MPTQPPNPEHHRPPGAREASSQDAARGPNDSGSIPAASRISTAPRLVLLAAILVAAAGAFIAYQQYESGQFVARALEAAQSAYDEERYEEAEQQALAVLEQSPDEPDALLLAARAVFAMEQYDRALGYLENPQFEQSDRVVPANLLRARILHRHLYRLPAAEATYRAVLEASPTNLEANTYLAVLLISCGRRSEAAPYFIRTIEADQQNDLLLLMGASLPVIQEPQLLELAHEATPTAPEPLVGLAVHRFNEQKFGEARQLLEQAMRLAADYAAAYQVMGSQLLLRKQHDALQQWLRSLPELAQDCPQAWIARGILAEQSGQVRVAIRCYGEAVQRSPEQLIPLARLAELFAQVDQPELASQFAAHVARLRQLDELRTGSQEADDFYLRLARAFADVGRLWEAVGWCRIASRQEGNEEAYEELSWLEERVRGIPRQLTDVESVPVLNTRFDPYPLPSSPKPPAD